MSENPLFLRLAVIGDPVAQSKSPSLHAGFLAEAGIRGSYEAIRVTKEEAGEALAHLAAAGYVGLNVTTPLKEEVLEHVLAADALASRLGAANTLRYDAALGGWSATNTDGVGARLAMPAALGVALPGKRILVLGAGPTARAAVVALQEAGAEVAIWNRSSDRARALAAAYGARVYEPGEVSFDGVFSALAPNPSLPESLEAFLRSEVVIVDANYGDRSTLATRLGRAVVMGEFMLEAQARESFRLWREAS
jgi:shikimate dehydrogenase